MTYYHCSPVHGLTVLEPGKPKAFDKPAGVYLTTLLPMALMYGVRNFEYSYGYTREGQIYYEEYFPNALEELYRGKQASLYKCAPKTVTTTAIPNEVISEASVTVLEEIVIEDVCEALLEQERLGTLVIHRHEHLSPRMLEWIKNAEAEEIRKRNLIQLGGPMAGYIREHYPKSWELVEEEERRLYYHGTAVSGLKHLEPRSVRDGEPVLYLSGSFVYALLYLWDGEKTGRAKKWVTGWLEKGVTYYEEQFPDQLRAFYSGVRGWVYCVDPAGAEPVADRERMALIRERIPVQKVIEVEDVYALLMEQEAAGWFRLLRFEDRTAEEQRELTARIAGYIRQLGLTSRDDAESSFFRRYFFRAWAEAARY